MSIDPYTHGAGKGYAGSGLSISANASSPTSLRIGGLGAVLAAEFGGGGRAVLVERDEGGSGIELVAEREEALRRVELWLGVGEVEERGVAVGRDGALVVLANLLHGAHAEPVLGLEVVEEDEEAEDLLRVLVAAGAVHVEADGVNGLHLGLGNALELAHRGEALGELARGGGDLVFGDLVVHGFGKVRGER